jgi:beta-phosphoglucomutase-like phosphatase (HAD superfamily)
VDLYGELLEVSGGKERMRHYFDSYGWPGGISDKDAIVKELHKLKTDLFVEIIESGELPLRPGVARIVDEAIAANVMLAVCSTSHERAVNLVVERLLGPRRKARFATILAGDVVSKKKPDPGIYNLASHKSGTVCWRQKPRACTALSPQMDTQKTRTSRRPTLWFPNWAIRPTSRSRWRRSETLSSGDDIVVKQ